MAIAVPSSSTTTFAGNINSLVITKPSGLAVGDLMIAYTIQNGAGTMTPPSGFTLSQFVIGGGASFRHTVWIKIADSDDVAASNFTWSWTLTDLLAGGMLRVTGFSTTQLIYAGATASTTDTANPSFANTITPFIPDSLLIMFLGGNGNDNAIGGYAIATSNPTWTEAWDLQDASSDGGWFACAYALRTQTTATGNSSVTGGEATMDASCILVAVARDTSASVTDTLTPTDSILAEFALTFTDTLTPTDSLTAEEKMVWINENKNSSTWINQDK